MFWLVLLAAYHIVSNARALPRLAKSSSSSSYIYTSLQLHVSDTILTHRMMAVSCSPDQAPHPAVAPVCLDEIRTERGSEIWWLNTD